MSQNRFGLSMLKEALRHPIVAFTHPLDPMAPMQPNLQFSGDDQNCFNLLILGCDVDYVNDKPIPIKNSLGRSDAIMVARVDFAANSVSILSIPRDTYCRIPDHGIHKINAAHAFGGPELAQETIKSVFGIEAKHYVRMNFIGFQKAVEALGGVNLDVEKKLDYDDNWGHLHVHLKQGFQHLTGYQAMGYVRMRHSDNDLMRSERQHKFIEAMRDQVKNPANLRRLPGVLNAITDAVTSDMKPEQLLTVVNFIQRLDKKSVQLATLPVDEGRSYVYVKVKQSQDVIQKMFFPDGEQVSINVPSYSLVHASSRYRRRRGKVASATRATGNAPRDDEGEPMQSDPGESAPGPDTASDSPSSDDNSDSSGSSSGNDAHGDSKPSAEPRPAPAPAPPKPETPSSGDNSGNGAEPHGQPG
jgi:LCP family protein required for cell wall assembly